MFGESLEVNASCWRGSGHSKAVARESLEVKVSN